MTKVLQFMAFGVLFFTCYGFLLNNGIVQSGNNTDTHYLYIMDQIGHDRQNMQLMEQFVIRLQQDLETLKNTIVSVQNKLMQVEADNQVLHQENRQMQKEITQMHSYNIQLHNDNIRLENEVYKCSNDTLKVREDLYSTAADQLKNATEIRANIVSLNQKFEMTITKLDSLSSSSEARSQDFLALLNDTQNNGKFISDLVTESKQAKNEFQKFQNSTNQKMADINQTAFLYACSQGETLRAGGMMKFVPQTAYGIKNMDMLQHTLFTCETAGVYLFSATIRSDSLYAAYNLRKNNSPIQFVVLRSGGSGSEQNTGTGVVVVSLNAGDELSVNSSYNNMNVVGSDWSCVTVVKIR